MLTGALHVRLVKSERVDDVIISRIVDVIIAGVGPAKRRGNEALLTCATIRCTDELYRWTISTLPRASVYATTSPVWRATDMGFRR